MKKFSAYLKYSLINSLRHWFFYIIAIIFSLFSSISFFIGNNFFSSTGNTNLLPFFSNIPYICIIIIPCLCFKHSDSLYDDFIPLKNFDKIFCKFISILIQYLILLVLIIPVPIFVSLFGNVDGGVIFSSLLCLIFYGASEISICLLLNELCENPITSIIVSVIISAIFNVAHLASVYIQTNTFFANLFKSISFAWHFDAAGKGIIDTRDLTWYLGLVCIFLNGASLIKLFKLGKQYKSKEKISNIFILIISFLVILNGQRWFTRFDFSKNKTYSVSSFTKKLLAKKESTLKITYYRSGNLSKYYPQVRDVSDFLQTFSSTGKDIVFSIIDPEKDATALALLNNYGITSQQISAVKNTNQVEYLNVYSSIVLEYEGNIEVIPYILSAQTLEYDLDGRIKHLITGTTRLINIVIGNDLSIDESTGYNMIIPWLNSQGFICNYIDISSPSFAQELSSTNGPLLVIGDNNILINQAIAIEEYVLSNKGNALFNISPYSIDFSNWTLNENKNTNIVEILENWGITFTNRIAADISSAIITMESQSDEGDSYIQNNVYREQLSYPLFISLIPQANTSLGFTQFWATPITIENENVIPYLATTSASWFYEIDRNKSENLIETNPFMLNQEDLSGKEKGSQILGVQIKGPLTGLFTDLSCTNSNIIVIPDQYMANTLLNFGYLNDDYRNFDFLTNTLLKLNNEEELAELQSKTTFDTSFYKISTEDQFIKYRNLCYIVFFIIIPISIILIALLVFVIHNRRLKNEIK